MRNQKGVELLIKCLDEIADNKIQLTLIGQINEDHYDNLIKARNYIIHIPYVPNEALNEYYQRSDIFVLPSYLDSWGMVVIEAMSNGVPVIVTENCGAKDAVKRGGGIIIKPDSIMDLKQAIEFYMKDEMAREIDGAKAKEIALSYNDINYQQKLKDILEIVNQI
ncbi:glycosyltransferase [Pedobacter sp. SL55]|nr:glycosyltransferase [Pedobacter sp. SL55]